MRAEGGLSGRLTGTLYSLDGAKKDHSSSKVSDLFGVSISTFLVRRFVPKKSQLYVFLLKSRYALLLGNKTASSPPDPASCLWLQFPDGKNSQSNQHCQHQHNSNHDGPRVMTFQATPIHRQIPPHQFLEKRICWPLIWHQAFAHQMLKLGTIRPIGELLEAKVRHNFLPWVGFGILLVAPLTIEVKPVNWRCLWLRCCELLFLGVILVVVGGLNRVPYLASVCEVNEGFVMGVASREWIVRMRALGTIYDRLFKLFSMTFRGCP